MKRTIYIILSFLLIVSCKENSEKNARKIQKSVIQEYDPIFLSLSPRMTNEIYNKEIKKLNSEGTITGDQFPLIIDDEEFLFKIQKKENCILLDYEANELIENSMDDNIVHQKCLKYNKLYEKKAKKVLNQFEKKYQLNPIQIPENLDTQIDELDFSMFKYKLFKDDKKYILFSYKNISPFDAIEFFGDTPQNPDRPKNHMGEMFKKMAVNEPLKFGIKVSIYYFHQDDFEKILTNLMNIYKNKKAIETEEKRKKEKRQNNIQNI